MKKGTAITFALGVFAGITLCGPAAQAATNLTAKLNDQPIYVDGVRVELEAYQIHDNNFVQLRDIGEAVGFNPNWEDIRPGDLIRFNTDASGHVVVVLAKYDEYISVTESSTNNKVLWGGQYFRWWLEEQSGYTCYTRYPTD